MTTVRMPRESTDSGKTTHASAVFRRGKRRRRVLDVLELACSEFVLKKPDRKPGREGDPVNDGVDEHERPDRVGERAPA
jgi:hypothetical protein